LQDDVGVDADFLANARVSISSPSYENLRVWLYECQCLMTASVESLVIVELAM
jgi:hypothetical protein